MVFWRNLQLPENKHSCLKQTNKTLHFLANYRSKAGKNSVRKNGRLIKWIQRFHATAILISAVNIKPSTPLVLPIVHGNGQTDQTRTEKPRTWKRSSTKFQETCFHFIEKGHQNEEGRKKCEDATQSQQDKQENKMPDPEDLGTIKDLYATIADTGTLPKRVSTQKQHSLCIPTKPLQHAENRRKLRSPWGSQTN